MEFKLLESLGTGDSTVKGATDLSRLLIGFIVKGLIGPGHKLPSVNKMSAAVKLNRLTVLKAMDELYIEGWVEKRERSGIFVSPSLPVEHFEKWNLENQNSKAIPDLPDNTLTQHVQNYFPLNFNDGYPDIRLFPVLEMARAYSTTLKDHMQHQSLSYYDVYGHTELRSTLSQYLHHSRGISNSLDNLMVTRGSTMGIYLAAKVVCRPGDTVAMGYPGYYMARELFVNEGLDVLGIEVDENGLRTDVLEDQLKRHRIKLLYITPHHNHPTTIRMNAERRLELLRLATKYGFYILEDDYDFEFQYDRRPILPIASIDKLQQVIYVGGFSKSLSPSMRLGFMMAHPRLIVEAGKWRKLIDRQGDSTQEVAFEKLLRNGVIDSTIRKAVRVYKERRDFAFEFLKSELHPYFKPEQCNGGLAFWTQVNIDKGAVPVLISRLAEKKVHLNSPLRFNIDDCNYTRLGFASMTQDEFARAASILRDTIRETLR